CDPAGGAGLGGSVGEMAADVRRGGAEQIVAGARLADTGLLERLCLAHGDASGERARPGEVEHLAGRGSGVAFEAPQHHTAGGELVSRATGKSSDPKPRL